MEGPSLFLAKEQLKPFKKKIVLGVSGNTRIDKCGFEGRIVKDVFSWANTFCCISTACPEGALSDVRDL